MIQTVFNNELKKFEEELRDFLIRGARGGANRTDYEKQLAECMEEGESKEQATSALRGHPYITQTQDGKLQGAKKTGKGNPKYQNAQGVFDKKLSAAERMPFTEDCSSMTTACNYMRELIPHMEKTDFTKCGCWKFFLQLKRKVDDMSTKEKKNWKNCRKNCSSKNERRDYKRAEEIEKKMTEVWEEMDKQWQAGLKKE
jgi:hypothetical protein